MSQRSDTSATETPSRVHSRVSQRFAVRLGASFALALVLVTIHIPVLHRAVFENPALERLDQSGFRYIDDALVKAGAAFGAARAANAFISLLQSTEVEAGIGVGVVVGVGEVLDPLNDLVERFSWVMLAALTSLGVQRFLLEIAPWACVDVLLSLACVLGLVAVWLRPGTGETGMAARAARTLRTIGLRVAVVAVALRLLVPLGALANEYVYDRFLAARQADAAAQVEVFRQQMQEREGQGALEQLSGIRSALQRIRGMVEDFGRHVLELLVLFVIQAAVLPLLTLWMILWLVRRLGSRIDPAPALRE
ncbi:hypothetical protein [Paucidesulfovibrio longus]|uniref:hypothetical protein n=1 Tax=Paucidesulfovibrio longus TaxID=889 RepID=UPI0003B58BDA|nr:hypothetical protein [Paucidesulfovibrio longus]